MLNSILPGEGTLTWLVTGLSLAAVLFPFLRGLRVAMRGWAATREVPQAELRKASKPGARRSGPEPLSLLMMRVLRKSLRDNERDGHPVDFVFDATRQYVLNEYEHHYARMISMYSSIMPPIGFIGTTGGMLILFISMHMADDALELGALAVALTSSIFALLAYASLEGLKIRLYGRLLAALRHVEDLFHEAEEKREQAAG